MPCGNIDVYCRKEDKLHEDLLAVVKCFPFFFYKVTEPFNPTSPFSKVQLNLAPYIAKATVPTFINAEAQDLFNFDRLEITEDNEKVVKFIRNCKQIAWPPFFAKSLSERTAFVQISKTLLVPLCCDDEVILDKTYSTYLHSLGPRAAGLKAGSIGIGSFQTWHGSPDARVRGTEIIYTTTEEKTTCTMGFVHNSDSDIISDIGSDVSDGQTTVVEAKLEWNKNDMPQLISTCVVSSFIENNLHRKHLSMVPAILIDLNKFVVCLYDSINDVLLISQSVGLQSKNRGHLSRSAVLFLWLVINHR